MHRAWNVCGFPDQFHANILSGIPDINYYRAEGPINVLLSAMNEVLRGKIQSGKNDASHWMSIFNSEYSEKLKMPVFPGSLNLALEYNFDWFSRRYEEHIIWFGREEYGGERDVLLLPCTLIELDRKAYLWTPTTAARDRPDPWVVEIICDIGLRATYGLKDGDSMSLRLPK